MLIDIKAKFARVQTANDRISDNLLTAKRATVVMGEAAACTVIALGAGFVLVGAFTQVAAALGAEVTGAQVAAATVNATRAGACMFGFDIADAAVSGVRKLTQAGDANGWLLWGAGGAVKAGSKIMDG